jgi:mono/diheme cytochrome c family protein
MVRVNDGGCSLWLKYAAATFVAAMLAVTLEANIVSAQQLKEPWQAPASAKDMKNPVRSTPEGLKAAKQLFQQNCVICHGKTGASNGPAAESLPQKPANFTDAKLMNKATDGEIFWKMTTGRAPMPSWQDRLSEDQRWTLVNYLRRLTKNGQYRYLGVGTGSRS